MPKKFPVEFQRDVVPLFAYPSDGDRITVWGNHIWDCGHGGPDEYRSEIHPPFGWAVFRNTATESDLDQAPPPGKRAQDPWVWYEATDHQGIGATLPSTGLGNTPVQATVVDAFFSSFGANAIEALNGCDDDGGYDQVDADCTAAAGLEDYYQWAQPILDTDYSFFVPAPPRPTASAQLVWESEDRCAEVPSDPGDPPGDDIDDVGEAHEQVDTDNADYIGSATCNIPDEVVAATENGQPGVRVTVKAHSSGVSYPANGYIAFAKRYKVAWDDVPTPGARVRTYDVTVNHVRVYDDAEPCGEDGEWNMWLRANENWLYPVAGSGDGGDAFYVDGVIDDEKCTGDDTYKQYSIGTTFHVGIVPGEQIRFTSRTVEIDPLANDVLPPVRATISGAGSYEPGTTDLDTEGAHTLGITVTETTPAAPTPGTLSIGAPSYGPNGDTGATATRVAGATPIQLLGSDAATLQYRFWKDGYPVPTNWSDDGAAPLAVDMTGAPDGRYTIEYAPVSGGGIVGERRLARVERDTTAPVITIPASLTVNADQAASKVVSFASSAVDALPGPVTFSCTPPTGTLFPNGANGPRSTVVTCTATDAVGNSATGSFTVTVVSPFGYINDFAVLAQEWVDIGSATTVKSGNVGALAHSDGVKSRPGFELVAGPSASFLGGSQLAAESVRLESKTKAGDVFYVDTLTTGNGVVKTPKAGFVPLFPALPAFPAFAAGGPDLTLKGTQTLAPGSYGQLTLHGKAIVTFSGGTYTFSGLELKPGATVRFAAATTIRVAGAVSIGNNSSLAPAAGSGVTPHHVVLYAVGQDGAPKKNDRVLDIGSHVTIGLNGYAPNGTLVIGSHTQATGAFIGKRVTVDDHVTLTRDSAFVAP